MSKALPNTSLPNTSHNATKDHREFNSSELEIAEEGGDDDSITPFLKKYLLSPDKKVIDELLKKIAQIDFSNPN